MTPRRKRLAHVSMVALITSGTLVAGTDCSDLTELIVVVDTDLAAPTELDRIEIGVSTLGGADAGMRTADLTSSASLPLSFSVQPGGDSAADVKIEAVGKLAGTTKVRATATTQLVAGKRLLLHLSLCRSCGANGCMGATARDYSGSLPTKPTCGATSDAGADASKGDGGCPWPEEMALIQTRTGKRFCIDRTEVTQAQYQAFLDSDAGKSFADQSPECAFNTDYRRPHIFDVGDLCENPAAAFDPKRHAKVPVVCVDWCDARAYCTSRGKRLCRQVGQPNAVQTQVDLSSAEGSEWYAACSNNGTTTYPYGNDYVALNCNGGDNGGSPVLISVDSNPSCLTKTDVYNMVGNVYEWEDACIFTDGDGGVFCPWRGGSVSQSESDTPFLRCNVRPASEGSSFRVAKLAVGRKDVGIRCCADPM